MPNSNRPILVEIFITTHVRELMYFRTSLSQNRKRAKETLKLITEITKYTTIWSVPLINKHTVSIAEAIHVPYRPQQISKRYNSRKNT